ncbi:MAG: MoxR family ATPase [Opitutales bacterium]
MSNRKHSTTKPKNSDRAVGSGSLLGGIGLIGFADLEPIVLAALATEEPLLLIGPHGTGKTLLLTQIAEALGLDFRHYNSSLLNFDDLIGFPLPDKDGSLEYVKTPASIWGAEAVIFDEISRCRPDIQNKLFPIVHERRAQGILLDDLRYRWAAMNPPISEDDDDGYLGSEPLDPALADRFAFIVQVPSWNEYDEEEQLAIILADNSAVCPDAATNLRRSVTSTRAALPSIRASIGESVAIYVRTLVALLAQAGMSLSPRRAGMLLRSVLAVHAAAISIDAGANPSDSALLAVRNGLPQLAEGKKIKETKLLGAHREAWRLAGVRPGDPLRAILTSADPVERIRLAVGATKIRKGEFSTIVSDAVSQLPLGAREAAVVHLFETGAVGRLNAAVAEQTAQIYADVATPLNFSETLHARNPRFATWKKIKDLLSNLNPSDPRAHLAANALASCFAKKQLGRPEDAEEVFAAWMATDDRLAGEAA